MLGNENRFVEMHASGNVHCSAVTSAEWRYSGYWAEGLSVARVTNKTTSEIHHNCKNAWRMEDAVIS